MIKKLTINAFYALAMILSASFAMQVSAQAPTCATLTAAAPTYTQNFDSLATTGTTNTTVPAGFGFVEVPGNATYSAGTGSSGTGDTYSFANTTTTTDRAFGSLQSGSVVPIIGACFINNTGSTITTFGVSYDGEQYRLGTSGRAIPDRLDFQYSVDATSLTAGNYTDFNALDFTAPVTVGTVGALDGNAAANRTASITALVPVNVAPGGTFYIRYNSFDAASADDGLAIDNFNLAANINAPTAGTVDISGRVTNARGRGIANARVTMTDGAGNARTALTDSRGFYMIEDAEAGQTVIFNARARGYNFTEPTQVVSLSEDTMTVNFSAYFGKGGGE